ncbi:MAG: GDP-mannose 4,6-dehydratase [Bacteroidetes bacterium]|nr:GDP-mannose 4,6-dehydratase [Bacteroidota bacterium]
MRQRTILVTGVLGQDGANMVEYLLRDPINHVYGMMRRSANPNFENARNFKNSPNFEFVYGDLTDDVSLDKLVREIQPEYFINFAANSFVGCSWDMPEQVFDVNALGVLRCLESIRKFKPNCRFYSAGSSEEFGDVDYSPQDIRHPIKPRSPYGASKAAARHLIKVYRDSYDMYAVHGILFNHEGTKRGEEFVTRKITKAVARIHHAIKSGSSFKPLELGNIDSKRDWSDSEDFVKGVWAMMNQPAPKDYVLSSGETHSIREFVERAFEYAGYVGEWKGSGLKETYVLSCKNKKVTVMKVNPDFYRPAEVELLLGNSIPAQQEIGWIPEVSFCNLVKKMVEYDIDDFDEGEKAK